MAGIDSVRKEAGTSEQATRDVFAAVLTLVKKNEVVRIPGFGTFTKHHREAREAINPQDPKGPKVHVEAKDVLKFKPQKGIDMTTPKAPAARGARR